MHAFLHATRNSKLDYYINHIVHHLTSICKSILDESRETHKTSLFQSSIVYLSYFKLSILVDYIILKYIIIPRCVVSLFVLWMLQTYF